MCHELGSAFYSCLYRPAQCARSWGRLSIPAFTGLHNVPGVGVGFLFLPLPACIVCQELGSAFYSCLYRPAQCARSWGRLSIPAFTGLHSVSGVVGRYSCLYQPAQCAKSWGRLSIPAFTGLHSVPGVGGRLSIPAFTCLHSVPGVGSGFLFLILPLPACTVCQELGSAFHSCLYRLAQCARSWGSAFYSCFYLPAQCARSWFRLSIPHPAFTSLHSVPGVGVGFPFLPLPACTMCQELGSAFHSCFYLPAQCARSWGRLSISIPILEPEILGNHNINTGTTLLSKTIVN